MSSPKDAPLASLDLLRRITDRHVIDQLLAAPAMTRAEMAARTGISKPTISESVRRLEEAGLVSEAGRQHGKRGRAGTFFGLRDGLGVAIAISAGPDGLVAEVYDLRGDLLRRFERSTPSPVNATQLDPLLRGLAEEAVAAAPGPVRGSALSVAGPVDLDSGRLVHLPDAPFLVDELDPRALLGGLLGEGLLIDNDVNWAALAEHDRGSASELDDFCYCHLGHGLGGAVVRRGEVVRGSAGLAGEIAHLLTRGPGGRAMRLVECFAAWDLLLPGSSAIDVTRVIGVLETGPDEADARREEIVQAVAGAIASMAALLNPAGVVVGGPWSAAGGFAGLLTARLRELSIVDVPVRSAHLGGDAPLAGARLAAVRAAQLSLLGPNAAAS